VTPFIYTFKAIAMYRSLFAALLFFYSASKAQVNNISLGQSFQQYASNVANSTNANNHNGSIVAFTPKEDTEGSPYLFKSWAKGHILLKTNKAFEEPSFVLNYDKMKGIIIVKIDERRMLEVNMEQIERFSWRTARLPTTSFISPINLPASLLSFTAITFTHCIREQRPIFTRLIM
jgi:hypothetical protein